MVDHFDREPSYSRSLIREMLEADPQAFLQRAIGVLRDRPESRGTQFVVTLLVANNLLVPLLCDSSLTREQAVALARGALRVDSMADMTLAKALIGSDHQEPGDPARLMDILEAVSDGKRILPALLRLLRHDDPHIRSKAVLLIGRGSPGVRWVERRLADQDARVRANAIESMWGMNSPDARRLLQKAMEDPNNRVAGNAIFGLYLLGDTSTIPELMKISESEMPLWRSTACWVMGETGDPRFLTVTADRLGDPDAMVRRRAYWALSRIKAAAAKVAQTDEWRVAARFRQDERRGRNRHVRLAVASTDAKEVPPVLPTQFLLCEEGHPVHVYQVVEREVPPSLSVAFVFPRSPGQIESPWIAGALRALQWRRNSDLWALVSYLAETGGQDAAPASADETVFCATADAIRASFLHPPAASICPGLWTAVWNAVKGQERLVRGENRIIIFSNAPEWRGAGLELISSVMTSVTLVQAVSTVDNPRLEDFCRKTRGVFSRVESEEEAARAIEQAYLQLLSRYEMSYPPVSAEARNLKIRIHTPSGWGEITLPIPAESSG